MKPGQIVAGFTPRNATSVRPVATTLFSAPFAGEIESTRYGLGWVSSFGLALSLAIETKEITESSGLYTHTIDATVLSASYRF